MRKLLMILFSVSSFLQAEQYSLIISVVNQAPYVPILKQVNETQEEEIQSQGVQNITYAGASQMFNLGKGFWEAFQNSISNTYNYNNVEIISNSQENSINSANYFILGLFGENNGLQIENNDPVFYNPPIENFSLQMSVEENFALPHGPTFVPIETATENDDPMFQASKDCQFVKEKHHEFIKQIQLSLYEQQNYLQNRIIENQITQNVPLKGNSFNELLDFCKDLQTSFHSLEVFQEFEELSKECKYLTHLYYSLLSSNKEYLVDNLSIFLQNIQQKIEKKIVLDNKEQIIEQRQDPQLILYFVQESFFIILFSLFDPNRLWCLQNQRINNIKIDECLLSAIDFSSQINILFSQKSDNIYVKINLNNQIALENEFSKEMSLSSFLLIIKEKINNQLESQCQFKIHREIQVSSVLGLTIILACIIILVLISLTMIFCAIWQLRAKEKTRTMQQKELLVQ